MDRAWAEVHLDRLCRNYRTLSEFISNSSSLMAVIKGNAYGHGAVDVARELEALNCRYLGLATIEEAIELREAGITLPILLLGPIDFKHVKLAAEHELTLTIIDESYAIKLSETASKIGVALHAHLAIDTGMSRFGLQVNKDYDAALNATMRINRLPSIQLEGIFTHFAAANDPSEDAFTKSQLNLYDSFSHELISRGLKLIRHCANSPMLLRFPKAHYDIARTGTLLYGLNPFGCGVDLKLVMELRAKIVAIKELGVGDTIGYGRQFTCERPTRIAIIPFGFVDGIHRSASNKAHALVNGQRVRIVGKICMDFSFLDITDIHGVNIGDITTLFGHDHGIFLSPYDCTVNYPGSAPELLAVLGNRIPRIFFKEGKVVGQG